MDLKKTIIIKRSKIEQPLTRGIEMMMEEDGGRIMFLPDDCTVEYVGEDSKALFEFPTIDQWVPMKDGFPEDSGEYLVTLFDGTIEVRYYLSTIRKWFPKTDMVAWMPLPKPYEWSEEDESNN